MTWNLYNSTDLLERVTSFPKRQIPEVHRYA